MNVAVRPELESDGGEMTGEEQPGGWDWIRIVIELSVWSRSSRLDDVRKGGHVKEIVTKVMGCQIDTGWQLIANGQDTISAHLTGQVLVPAPSSSFESRFLSGLGWKNGGFKPAEAADFGSCEEYKWPLGI